MKIQLANDYNKTTLLDLMHEAYEQEPENSGEEWATIKVATNTLLSDPAAGEAYLIFDDSDCPIGYMIMYRRFSVQSGGYFTRVDDVYLRGAEPARFRDEGSIP